MLGYPRCPYYRDSVPRRCEQKWVGGMHGLHAGVDRDRSGAMKENHGNPYKNMDFHSLSYEGRE